MEVKVEVQVALNQKMVAEFMRFGLGKVWKVLMILAAAMTVIFLLGALMDSYYLSDAIMSMALMIVFYFLPDFTAGNALRQQKKKNGGQLPTNRLTFGERIEDIGPGQQLIWDYSRVERVVHLKHSYVLMTDKRTGILVDLNGFTKGSFPELKQLLREKCPNILIPE